MGNSAAHSMQPKIIWVGSREVIGAWKCDDVILCFAITEMKFVDTLDLVSVELPFLWNMELQSQ